MLSTLKICLHSIHLFWSKEGPMFCYWLILYSIFFFFKAQSAYVEYGQFCIPNSLALILSRGFIQIAIFLAVSTPSWIYGKKQDEEGLDLKSHIPGTSFQSQTQRKISSCSFVSKCSIQKLKILMWKFLSLDRLTTPLPKYVLFSWLSTRLLCIHANKMKIKF